MSCRVPIITERYINELYIHPLAIMFHHPSFLRVDRGGTRVRPFDLTVYLTIFFPSSDPCVWRTDSRYCLQSYSLSVKVQFAKIMKPSHKYA